VTPAEARALLAEADLVCPAAQVAASVDRLAGQIAERLADVQPLVLTVMGGAVVFAGHLLPKLAFPLDCDYLHVTRYGDATHGSNLTWVAEPRLPVAGRIVLVLDDILDEGVTLAAIKARVLERGAAQCLVAVLTEKDTGREKPIRPDFVGLVLPNRYVFGYGMDVKGAWRNLPAIYAVKGL